MLKILEILEERNNSLEIREWKIPTFSNGGGWGLINDVLSNSPLFCGIGGPGKNSSYTGVVLSIRGTSLAPSKSQVNCLKLIPHTGSFSKKHRQNKGVFLATKETGEIKVFMSLLSILI